MFQHVQINNFIHKWPQRQKPLISIHLGKAFNKNPTYHHEKGLNILGLEGMSQPNTEYYINLSYQMGDQVQEPLGSLLLFNIELEVLLEHLNQRGKKVTNLKGSLTVLTGGSYFPTCKTVKTPPETLKAE